MIVRYARAARRQIGAIWRYSLAQWGEKRAEDYVRAIDDVILAVAQGRRKASPCDDLAPGLMRSASGSHHIYFRLDQTKQVLHVVVVLHQRMDPSRHLKGD